MIVTNSVRLVTSTPSRKLKKIVRLLAFVSLISADGTENRLFFLITLSGDSDLERGGDAPAFRFAW
jgi:hypothetical protein